MSVSSFLQRPKKGDFNKDGTMRYWGNNKTSKTGEYWVTPQKYEDLCLKKTGWNLNWHRKNPEKARSKVAKWRAANLEESRKNVREWRAKNPEWQKWYNKAFPEVRMATVHRLRAVKSGAEDINHNKGIEKTLHAMRFRLDKCTKIKWSLDHILPLSAGGKHHHSNLQVLPLVLNKQKGHRIYWELPDCWKNPPNPVDLYADLVHLT